MATSLFSFRSFTTPHHPLPHRESSKCYRVIDVEHKDTVVQVAMITLTLEHSPGIPLGDAEPCKAVVSLFGVPFHAATEN